MRFLSCLFLLLMSFSVSAQITNWKGYLDTSIIWISDTTTIKYSKIYNQTEGVASSLVTMVNDTARVRLGADSTKILYGFQIGGPVINSLGVLDTAWSGLDTLDTISRAGYKTFENGGFYDVTSDFVTVDWGSADTSHVTGYAYQIRPVRPVSWDVFIRFWYVGRTGTCRATANKVVCNIKRMVGIPTVQK